MIVLLDLSGFSRCPYDVVEPHIAYFLRTLHVLESSEIEREVQVSIGALCASGQEADQWRRWIKGECWKEDPKSLKDQMTAMIKDETMAKNYPKVVEHLKWLRLTFGPD